MLIVKTAIIPVILLIGIMSASAQTAVLVDRGLPTTNLNLTAGASQSNVCWGDTHFQDGYFYGDTFTVAANTTWNVSTLRLWFVGFNANNNTNLTDDSFLGGDFGNLSLYIGVAGGPLTRVALASFINGSNSTDNPNVIATRVQYNDGTGSELDYQSNKGYDPIVQIDFTNLNLNFAAGTTVQFGLYTDADWAALSASNAALSGSPQDQADGLYDQYQISATDPNTATLITTEDSTTVLWNKPTDINVQVLGTAATPEPATWVLLLGGVSVLLSFRLVARRSANSPCLVT